MSKTPPHNLDAEKSVLGSIFIKPAVLDLVASVLVTDDFFLPAHREIFDAMVSVAKRKRGIDPVTVADELKVREQLARLDGGQSYLTELYNGVPTAENAAHYARIVREKALLRQVIAASAEAYSSAHGNVEEVETFVQESIQKLARLVTRDSSASEALPVTVEKILANLEAAQLGKVAQKIPTGIARLDDLLGGGMGRGHLIVPCGLTSMGKSSWGVQVVARGARDRKIPALVFSLEQPRAEIVVKCAANLARLDSGSWTVRPGDRVDWDAVTEASQAVADLDSLIRVEEHREIGKIVAVATAWRARNPGPAVVFVDHIQKVQGVRSKNGNRQEEVWGIASALKNMAKDLDLAVVAPAQLDNDAAKDNRAPRIGDIRDSKAIEHEADVVIGIHRERMPKQENGRAIYDSDCELIVLKHRGGRIGKRTVRWVGSWQGFEDKDEE